MYHNLVFYVKNKTWKKVRNNVCGGYNCYAGKISLMCKEREENQENIHN